MYVQANVEIPVNLNSKQKDILREFENEGGTSKKHSPKSQGFFLKIKRSLGRFNLISFQLTITKV